MTYPILSCVLSFSCGTPLHHGSPPSPLGTSKIPKEKVQFSLKLLAFDFYSYIFVRIEAYFIKMFFLCSAVFPRPGPGHVLGSDPDPGESEAGTQQPTESRLTESGFFLPNYHNFQKNNLNSPNFYFLGYSRLSDFWGGKFGISIDI